MMANPNGLKLTDACAHIHKTVLRETPTLNLDTFIGFLSGKEENVQVFKTCVFPRKFRNYLLLNLKLY